MDIARVNSIFPNDILALMPSSFTKKVKSSKKQKLVVVSSTMSVTKPSKKFVAK